MFPFILKGKVPLGMRRDFQLSESGLQERIAERLIHTGRKSESRKDGSPAGDGRGLVAGGLSRLKSMGFLTAVRVRKIRIISREDFLFAGYEMDATASTLVSMVLIPLVLGSILFRHSAFTFYESLIILVLLVLTSWGLDVYILVMMLRHEIFLIASEIKAIARRRDAGVVDAHHRDLSPEDLLATAYYYERNGLVRRCEAYLLYLVERHPDSFEALLARENVQRLEGLPPESRSSRTREGQKSDTRDPGGGRSRLRQLAGVLTGRSRAGSQPAAGNRAPGQGRKNRRPWPLSLFPGRRKGGDPSLSQGRKARTRDRTLFGRRRKAAQKAAPVKPRERALQRRQERLERRDLFARNKPQEGTTRGARLKARLSVLFRWESRDERRYRKDRERWLHGPRPTPSNGKGDSGPRGWKEKRPNWMRSKEEREALQRQKRWSQGPPGPGEIQRSRDRWGKWRLLAGRSGDEREMARRQARASEESPLV